MIRAQITGENTTHTPTLTDRNMVEIKVTDETRDGYDPLVIVTIEQVEGQPRPHITIETPTRNASFEFIHKGDECWEPLPYEEEQG